MKLYTNVFSPNCRRVGAAIHHLRLDKDVEFRFLTLGTGELAANEELRAANPNVKVPTLVDGDFSLWEANPIMIYLADRQGAEDFCPSDLRGRFEILRWLSWEAQHYNRAVNDVVWETVVKPSFGMGEPEQAKIDAGLANYRTFAAVLDTHLVNRPFMLGDKVTVADFAVGAGSAFIMHPLSQIPLDAFPNVKAWYARLDALPAWSKTAPPFQAEAAE